MRSNEPPTSPMSKIVFTGESQYGLAWENDRYYGSFRKDTNSAVISISALDNSSHHDWRDFQAIKNELVGPEWEAAELYPAESRLRDPSNRFYLWCFPQGVLNFGWTGERRVIGAAESIAPQRALDEVDYKMGELPGLMVYKTESV